MILNDMLFRGYVQQFGTEYLSGNCTHLLFKVSLQNLAELEF